MKNYFYALILLLFASSIFSACSKDDPEPQMEARTLGLFAQGFEVSVPESMENSDDPHASIAAGYVASVNSFAGYNAFFTPIEGAKRSSQPINASNLRTTADYTVYEWSYGGQSFAYQYSEQNGKYIFESFYKESAGDSYVRYFYAEENKDGKGGLFKMFNIGGDDPSEVVATWSWNVLSTGSLKFVYDVADGGFRYEVLSNKDLSGTIKMTSEGQKFYDFEWDSAGNGFWKQYDGQGAIIEQGSWTA